METAKQNIKTMTTSEVHELQARVVEELLEIQKGGFLYVGGTTYRPECHCREGNVMLLQERFGCPQCARYVSVQEFDGMGRNKTAVDLGTLLYETGGSELMTSVAYEFQAKGGDTTRLSRAWHTIGRWWH